MSTETATEKWHRIDHVLVVTPDGIAPEEGDVAFRWAGSCGPDCKPCACIDCYGSGVIYDDEEREQQHEECGGTGVERGTCWVTDSDLDWREALGERHDDWWLPGRWIVEYHVLDWDIECFPVEARRIGPAASVAGQEQGR